MSIPRIFIASDATGETAERVTRSVLLQFPEVEVSLDRISGLRDMAALEALVTRAREEQAVIIYTIVDADLRKRLQALCEAADVPGIDILGPVLGRFEQVFDQRPITVPGLLHRQDEAYDRRIAAIEYTVKHDDGLGFNTLDRADLVLVGPSRTGKTPLSIFLANAGYFVANVPFITDRVFPTELPDKLDAVVVGLLVQPTALVQVRAERLRRLGADAQQSRYAEPDQVGDEVAAAQALYTARGWPVIDVTGQAVEEIAVEVMALLRQRRSRVLASTGDQK